MSPPRADGDTLRNLLRTRPVLMPGVWDPLSAILCRDAGFEVAFASGFAVSGTLLGRPDIGLLTQPEMAEVARRICAAVPSVAVVVDADTGYGDESNVARTTELWEAAGAAGMFLEDQVWPKRCGHMPGKEVVDASEWLAKIETVLATRDRLHLTARTDARAPRGLDEAIERGRAAADLGVDAVFVEAPEGVEELEAIASALSDRGALLVANIVEHGRTPMLSAPELHELGYDLIVSPVTSLFAATRAMAEALEVLKEKGTMRGDLDRLTSFADFTATVGLDRD